MTLRRRRYVVETALMGLTKWQTDLIAEIGMWRARLKLSDRQVQELRNIVNKTKPKARAEKMFNAKIREFSQVR